MTNDPQSPLALAADVVVPLLAGDERSVAATKTYTSSLHALAQIAGAAPFERLPEVVASVADDELARRSRFDPLATAAFVTATGRGLALSTACESALKLRELSGIPAEALSPPDLMHGPVAALGPSGWVWAVEPDAAMLRLAAERRAPMITVPVRGDLPPWARPIVAVLPAQAAALRLAELRGGDPDAPHGLRKVTLTT